MASSTCFGRGLFSRFLLRGGEPQELALRERRRNFWLHVGEGAALIGGLGVINANTVGTALVQDLGGSPWMVAMMPMATTVGFALGPILTAHHLDKQPRFLPILRRTLPFSRLPLLVTSVTLWTAGNRPLSLWVVLIGALTYGVIGGLSVGAWQQLVGKTVDPTRRPSLFATRYLAANVVGFGAGFLVKEVLSRWPGPRGYAILHFVTFLGAIVSYRFLLGVREPESDHEPQPANGASFWANLRCIPSLFAVDVRLRRYLWSVAFVNSQFLLIGFMAVHARGLLGADEGYIGTLTSAQMLGAVCGTVLAATLGDRVGSRAMLLSARTLMFSVAALACTIASDWGFRALFALFGAAFWVNLVGHNTRILELSPSQRRSTVLAVFNLVQVPSMLAAAQIGAWLWGRGTGFQWIAGLSAVGFGLAFLTAWPDPQNRSELA